MLIEGKFTVFWHQSWFKPYYRKLSLTVALVLMLTLLGACTNNAHDFEPTDGGQTLQDNEFLMTERTLRSEPKFALLKADVDEEGRMYVRIGITRDEIVTLYVGEPFDFNGEGILTLQDIRFVEPPSDPEEKGGGNRAIFKYEKAA